MKKSLMILFLTLVSGAVFAATVTGHVKDAETDSPLEFANVALHNIPDDEVVTGTMTGVDGSFRIFNIPGEAIILSSAIWVTNGKPFPMS
ncbi:MAG: hypothetical protein U5N26_12100 [Candidatus Marinimicrobia bacterium]|nr:hypothetical protein [Candidatus Neomarinimicrobiota bacterium]